MARQAKERKVCKMPRNIHFQTEAQEISLEDISSQDGIHNPIDDFESDYAVIMSVEEYESIRLIDYMEFTQEECARHMQVARTTVQRIYNEARRKLSIFLVEGFKLYISGGSYEICENSDNCNCNSDPCKSGSCNHTML